MESELQPLHISSFAEFFGSRFQQLFLVVRPFQLLVAQLGLALGNLRLLIVSLRNDSQEKIKHEPIAHEHCHPLLHYGHLAYVCPRKIVGLGGNIHAI